MQKYNGTLLRKFDDPVQGNASVGTSVVVRKKSDNSIAPIYSVDDINSIQKPNPFTTDAFGRYSFFAPNGKYLLQFGDGSDEIEISMVDNLDHNELNNRNAAEAHDAIYSRVFSSIRDLLNYGDTNLLDGGVYFVAGYYDGSTIGGGEFVYKASMPQSSHDGGLVIAKDAVFPVDLTNQTQLAAWYVAPSSGMGCFSRITDDMKAVDFGVRIGFADSTAAFQKAAKVAASSHKELNLPDGLFSITKTCVLDGVVDNFRTVKMRGTFGTTGVALNYTPDTCGTVIYTVGCHPIEIKFNKFSNENFSLRGIGFCDSSYYPSGQPLPAYPAIKIKKGNADGSDGRYISGNILHSCGFSSYESCIELDGMSTIQAQDNFIGPFSVTNCSAHSVGDFIRADNVTLNHLWITDSNLFGLNGFGVNVRRTVGGTGGFAAVTYNNCMFEGTYGMLNGAGVSDGGRHTLVLNSVDRESCGRYGQNASGVYEGNPLGVVNDTDIIINGKWTKDLAYGESSLPIVEAGATISSTVPVQCITVIGSKVLTTKTVNLFSEFIPSLSAGASIYREFVGTGTDAIDATLTIILNGGRRGVRRAEISGYTTGAKFRNEYGTIDSTISVVFGDGISGRVCSVAVTNNSTLVTSVEFVLENSTGLNVYSVS